MNAFVEAISKNEEDSCFTMGMKLVFCAAKV